MTGLPEKKLKLLWEQLYPDSPDFFQQLLTNLSLACEEAKHRSKTVHHPETKHNWHHNAITYALYVEHFAGDFEKLTQRLGYFKELGINTLWLLPVFKSPQRDNGFDVEDYFLIREDFLGKSKSQKIFFKFIERAHESGIRLIVDVPLNHCSDQHPFFLDAVSNPDSQYRDFFIWSKTRELYSDCRILFKGMVESNWEPSGTKENNDYYFHRFYPFQPDFNYRNPNVFLYMLKVLCFWKNRGIDGFRLDAVPFLWKKEQTDCESLKEVHLILKLLKLAIDSIEPSNTLFLAEACQPPKEIIKYFADGSEMNGAYHFPLMPQIFNALAQESPSPVQKVLSHVVTPDIPANCVWFSFLRLHDELTLEMVTKDEQATLFRHYCHRPEWNFRNGEGISARLAELLKGNADHILLAYSILLTLCGAPIIYYGDETAEMNNQPFFEKMTKKTGYADSRFLVRGPLKTQGCQSPTHSNAKNPDDYSPALKDDCNHNSKNSPDTGQRVFSGLKKMLHLRGRHLKGLKPELKFIKTSLPILAYTRKNSDGKVFIFIQNLSRKKHIIHFHTLTQPCKTQKDLLTDKAFNATEPLVCQGFQSYWLTGGSQ